MGAEQQKGKFLIFHFCCCQGLRDEVLTSLNIKMWLHFVYTEVGLLDSQASEKHSLDSMAKCALTGKPHSAYSLYFGA